MRNTTTWKPVAYAGLVLVIAGCSQQAHQVAPAKALPTATVSTVVLGGENDVGSEEVIGTVRAKVHSTIEAKVSGRILAMPVRLGQSVPKGALLASLDVAEIQARFDQASVAYAQSKIDYDRASALLKANAGTKNEFDAASSRYQMTKAGLDEARAMLGYARIRAPFAGVITAKLAEVGDEANPGKPLLEIQQPGLMRLEVSLPESLWGKISVGTKLNVGFDQMPEQLEGTVSEIAPAADANTRTFLAKIDLPQSDRIRAGQFGRAFVPLVRRDVMRLPATAVVKRGQMEIAFVVENDNAKLRLIKTGKQHPGQVEVVSGLVVGERVVTEGASSLQDGQPVRSQP